MRTTLFLSHTTDALLRLPSTLPHLPLPPHISRTTCSSHARTCLLHTHHATPVCALRTHCHYAHVCLRATFPPPYLLPHHARHTRTTHYNVPHGCARLPGLPPRRDRGGWQRSPPGSNFSRAVRNKRLRFGHTPHAAWLHWATRRCA